MRSAECGMRNGSARFVSRLDPPIILRIPHSALGWGGTLKERVLVAMSGGVDSSVAAALLVEAGRDVVGAPMKLFCYGGAVPDRPCCSLDSIRDARLLGHPLGLPHFLLDPGDRV